MDLLPLIGITGGIAMCLGLIVANMLPAGAGRPSLKILRDGNEARAEWKRGLVLCLPATLGRSLVLAGSLWLIAISGLGGWVLHGSDQVWSWAVVLVQVVSAVVVLLIVGRRRLATVRKVVGMTADVVGFWPVTSHPFAGASYREPVLDGLRQQLKICSDVTVVLVGHSQGSVLCAWLLRESPNQFGRVALVTCGSPLISLYADFFFPLTSIANSSRHSRTGPVSESTFGGRPIRSAHQSPVLRARAM